MTTKPTATETAAVAEATAAPTMSRVEKMKSLMKDPFVISNIISATALVVLAVVVNNSKTPLEVESEDV